VEADVYVGKAAVLVEEGWQRRAYLLLATRFVQTRQPVVQRPVVAPMQQLLLPEVNRLVAGLLVVTRAVVPLVGLQMLLVLYRWCCTGIFGISWQDCNDVVGGGGEREREGEIDRQQERKW